MLELNISGRKLSDKKELNGISLAGVGNKTIMQNIQVSYSMMIHLNFMEEILKQKN
ncbi:MAG: hypothetical protein HC854_15180 [Flavobacterium sp.]|nr:hypothetical protein [Flavobacterium sp.]